jgi:SAM-dependent methyltransferase
VEQEAYSEIAELERTHWWYSARRKILRAMVQAELRDEIVAGPALDLGCGTGANLEVVTLCGTAVGADFSRFALAYSAARGGYADLVCANATGLPFADQTFAWLFALDLLEHLDDVAAAGEIWRVLRPGGRAVITVPAFSGLWGGQDEVGHHLRRYSRPALEHLVREAGLEIRRITYINTAMFLPIWVVRRGMRLLGVPVRSENTFHPRWANPLLERMFAAEARIVPYVSLPFGVSLLCVVTRPGIDSTSGS